MTTAIRNVQPAPAVRLLFDKGYINPGDYVCDYGAGYGRNAEFLRQNGVDVYAYDPYLGIGKMEIYLGIGKMEMLDFSYGTTPGEVTRKFPSKSNWNQFDIILTSYVLNVVELDEEEAIIRTMKDLSPYKRQFHIVRDDITSTKGYRTSRGFQRLVHLEDYGYKLLKQYKGKYKIYGFQGEESL